MNTLGNYSILTIPRAGRQAMPDQVTCSVGSSARFVLRPWRSRLPTDQDECNSAGTRSWQRT